MSKRIILHPYLAKIIYDQKIVLIFLFTFTASFEYFYSWLVLELEMSQFIKTYVNIMPSMFRGWLGVQAGSIDMFNRQILAFGFAHPFVMIILSFLPVSISTRYIAGEVENRTYDLFLTKPLKRYLIPAHIFVFLMTALFIQVVAMLGGSWLAFIEFEQKFDFLQFIHIAIAGYAFYISMAALAMMISVFNSERGKALMVIIGILIALYFFDSIIKVNESTAYLKAFSYFQLYQPTDLVRGEQNVWQIVFISSVLTVIGFIIAMFQFRRRDF
jgi:ABC-2 type transport system permease protein